jgi:hypothetical protein
VRVQLVQKVGSIGLDQRQPPILAMDAQVTDEFPIDFQRE